MTEDANDNYKPSPDAQLLDELLSVAARKPGEAATLPAVIRVVESLEPAGGPDFPIFPASYAGISDNDPPVYDLSGIEYGDVDETIRGKGKNTVQRRQILRAERCAIDSPQSQANRTEVAFVEDVDLRSLVPQGTASIPLSAGNGTESLLRLPHRVGDFRVRLSDKQTEVRTAISSFAGGDCLPLLKMMPTSVVFGFWDSRGEQGHKHARILLSRIDAFNVIPCRRHAVYSGPYSKDEFAAAVLDKVTPEKSEGDAMSEKGFTNAPAEGLGGVIVKGKVERLALISLTDISRLNCRKSDGKLDEPLTNAARRYVFALAAIAEAYPRSTGSHRLRSGCELINTTPPTIELRGAQFPRANELMGLYGDRKRLCEVAKQAMMSLGIPSEAGTFSVSKQALQNEMRSSSSETPTGSTGGQPAAKKARKRSR